MSDKFRIIALFVFFAAYTLTAYLAIDHLTKESKMAIVYKMSSDDVTCEDMIDYVKTNF